MFLKLTTFRKGMFYFLLLITVINHNIFSQIGNVQLPTYQTFTPVSTTQSHNYTPSYQANHLEQLRIEQEQRIQNQNNQLIQQANKASDEKRKAWEEFLKEERKDEIQRQFDLLRKKPIDANQLQEYLTLKEKLKLANHYSADYQAKLNFYTSSFTEIQQMLEGKIPLNIKRAVFLSENPWYGNTKSYKNFCNQIDQLVWICRQVLKQENLSESNSLACHYAIQKLFHDTIVVHKADGTPKTIFPLRYDFNDNGGSKDFTKIFVHKLLSDKTGQCHSLPLLYLILAQELKVAAYLTLAPNHSYIKYDGGYGIGMLGFECTNGNLVTDEWIVASGYISSAAIRNGIYLAPQEHKETIANCLIDLALSYQSQLGYDDFVINCCEKIFKYSPSNITAMLTYSNCIVAYCFAEASKNNFPPITQMEKFPDLKKRYGYMLDVEKEIEASGYIKIPKEQYDKWLSTGFEQLQKEKHEQLSVGISNRIKNNTQSSTE